ncbi:hypothetical protein FTUN_2385 [Frigoriglobus tundricola]|uniref:Uncharacterized protein n=1 Tax=Frigoriglobus tundricola TaxID=2774151 RepID=A0A6M5YL85_9BACT|nr:hypothetical protein FTUN_2385 [Frigoriglobus tundricola]
MDTLIPGSRLAPRAEGSEGSSPIPTRAPVPARRRDPRERPDRKNP